jgi:flagellar basal-body rod protein FlgF
VENTLLIGLSKQVALRRELDVVSNNIANLNTTGFKADMSVFEEYLMPTARATDFPGRDARLSYVQDRATWHDLSQGPAQVTGNPLDISIDGNAFLAVQTPRGERYTRNGAMQINAAGQLVTGEGYQVLGANGPIVFQRDDSGISISADGTVSVREGINATVDSVRGRIRMVSFAQPQQLTKDGSSTFAASGNMAPQAAPEGARIVQGTLEKSNVRAVIEMTRMIDVSRTYTQIAGLMQQQGDLRRTAIEKLAEVPA